MRIFMVMLGFNTPEMIKGALQNVEDTTTDAEHRRLVKVLFNCGYPLPCADANNAVSGEYAANYGWQVVPIENKGVVENHNYAIHEFCHPRKGDYYVTFDPDVRMQQVGWVSAMIEALETDPDVVFCCAARPYHNEGWCIQQHGRNIETLTSHLKIAHYKQLIAWSMGMYKGEWLATRARNFCASNPFYGYSEHCEYDRMNAAKKKWVSLVDFYDHHLGAEDQYVKWKAESAAHTCTVSFEQWLKGWI